MPRSQYWMMIFIIIIVVLWLLVRKAKIKKNLFLVYYLTVVCFMCNSFYNDQMAFEDAFTIGHLDSITSVTLTQEIYLSYYLFIAFNFLMVVFMTLIESKKNTLKLK